ALRDDSREMLNALAAMGKTVHLVSGDEARTVARWADELGIERYAGGVDPEGKKAYVERLQAGGAVVLAVGDGINDAPHLGVAQALDAARRTRRVVRQNLGWALAYNLSFIPLAASGWISAWMAALGMSLSSLLVVGNAWRLRR